MEPKPSKKGQKSSKIEVLGGPGQSRDGAGGHLGPKVRKVTKNMVRGPPPGYPVGDHFGTKSDKIQKKGVPDERLGRKRRMQRKKVENWRHPGGAHMQWTHACAVQTQFLGLRKR